MSQAVEVRSLTKRFGDVVALDDISFDVGEGELFGLVGPDGAGKTTLFRILTTLLVPDAGSATVLGSDVVRDLWTIRSRVGYMPGGFSLYPDLSVAENLEFFAAVFGTTVEKGRELIAPIYRQLEPFRDRRAEALSGGMKQKLALSCALVHRPDILLLDEPTTGVDAVSRREFWDQLATLKASGLTIVVSTPYMDEAMRCDRIALIHGGRILDIDAPLSIGADYEYPLFAVRGADRYGMLKALRAFPHVHSVFLFGDALHYADERHGVTAKGERTAFAGHEVVEATPARMANEVRDYLHAHDFCDAAVEPIDAGIEDSFMARMGAAA
ncbi:MAG: ABC transporter ATP-binding protein [Gemmatimonadota bacterium]|nr:ABC transporter ATP-binding protein [Gemmatimonadota bacterium]